MTVNPTSILKREAVAITKDLGNVVFIGAVAVHFHTKISRASRDLDFILAAKMTEKELSEKGYIIQSDGNRYSPRNYKVDIYNRGNAINKINIDTIINTSKIVYIRGTAIKIASQVMIVSKYKAHRSQDIADLQDLVLTKKREIKWDELANLVDDTERSRIKTYVTTNFL